VSRALKSNAVVIIEMSLGITQSPQTFIPRSSLYKFAGFLITQKVSDCTRTCRPKHTPTGVSTSSKQTRPNGSIGPACFKTLGFATHQMVSDFTHGSWGKDYIHPVIDDPNLEGHDNNYEGEISYYLCQDAFSRSAVPRLQAPSATSFPPLILMWTWHQMEASI
jgi:hypothetical protein